MPNTNDTMNLDELFAAEEGKSLSAEKAKIAAEDERYRTDPAYRAAVIAEQTRKAEAHEAAMAALPADSDEDEDEDEDEY